MARKGQVEQKKEQEEEEEERGGGERGKKDEEEKEEEEEEGGRGRGGEKRTHFDASVARKAEGNLTPALVIRVLQGREEM